MINKVLFAVILGILLAIGAHAQLPDLTAQSISIQTTQLNSGEPLRLDFTVKNTGNANAPATHIGIYLSASPVRNNATLLGELSCEAIAANSQSDAIHFTLPLPYNVTPGNQYIIIVTDLRNVVSEANEANDFAASTTIQVGSQPGGKQNLPYPILLLHGLNSDYRTWDSLKNSLANSYGWSYGGNMNFCLNQDGSNATANKALDYKDWTDTAALTVADFYTVNFNVALNGEDVSVMNPSVLSNQAAIVKQGLAVKDAIRHVLAVAGRDKVVLLAHSMGGLASREYLQNPVNWQSDSAHHVAKLATLGTPHGGSNSSAWGLGGLAGINERSEAVRDLRYDYYYSGAPGVYLFGGRELNSVMSNFLFSNYLNIDVNCNGTIDNIQLQGLNQQSLPNNLAYACLIGDGSSLGGDGIVDAGRANLNNYFAQVADTFVSISSSALLHLDLLNQIAFQLKTMDEPGERSLAYQADTAHTYFGNFTVQSAGSNSIADSDYYRIPIDEYGELAIDYSNLPVPEAGLLLTDSTGRPLLAQTTLGKSNISTPAILVAAGNYWLNLHAVPGANSWKTPYTWKANFKGYGSCSGANRLFDAGVFGYSYQWQVDSGTGFMPVQNDAVYAGANTKILTISAATDRYYGFRYRCLVNGNYFTPERVLKFYSCWTGAASDDWHNAANWSCGLVPNEKTDVYLYPGTPNSPVIRVVAACRSMVMKPGAALSINDGGHLQIAVQ